MEGKNGYKKGLWTEHEDRILVDYIRVHGRGKWNQIAKMTDLKRCGKSCRLRWMNYLSPSVKRGNFSEEEDELIIRLHKLLGNRWSLIAGRVPGRTDNQVKNHWNTHLCKKLGIIKKRSIKSVSSLKSQYSTIHNVEEMMSHRLPVNSNSTSFLPSSDDGDINIGANNITGNTTLNVYGSAYNEQPQCVESLWFANHQFHLHSPELMEFIDGYPLDDLLMWQGL